MPFVHDTRWGEHPMLNGEVIGQLLCAFDVVRQQGSVRSPLDVLTTHESPILVVDFKFARRGRILKI
jgi:hypothetical protein